MNWTDHSRGFQSAKAGDHRNGACLHCNKCGERVRFNGAGVHCAGRCTWGLHVAIVDRFDDDAMACRFHVRPTPERWGDGVLVWAVSGKHEYTTIVSPSNADAFKPFGGAR